MHSWLLQLESFWFDVRPVTVKPRASRRLDDGAHAYIPVVDNNPVFESVTKRRDPGLRGVLTDPGRMSSSFTSPSPWALKTRPAATSTAPPLPRGRLLRQPLRQPRHRCQYIHLDDVGPGAQSSPRQRLAPQGLRRVDHVAAACRRAIRLGVGYARRA